MENQNAVSAPERILHLKNKVLAKDQLSREEGLELTRFASEERWIPYLMAAANEVRLAFAGKRVHTCTIINAKSGACAEYCSFCSQSAFFNTEAPVYGLMEKEKIVAEAEKARDEYGSKCFGIVQSGRGPVEGPELDATLDAIRAVRDTGGIQPDASLGILDRNVAKKLHDAGIRGYNHNLQTSRRFYPQIVRTMDYEERVETIKIVKEMGWMACSGGIYGMGESWEDRIDLLLELRELNVDVVPLNFLHPIPGTPLGTRPKMPVFEALASIAISRLMLPEPVIHICGGREHNLEQFQSMIFFAGASGVMLGNYLTTEGLGIAGDHAMMQAQGLAWGPQAATPSATAGPTQ